MNSDEQIVERARQVIVNNLATNYCYREVALLSRAIDNDKSYLLEHIKGLKALLTKAEEIIEKEKN